MPTAEFKPSTVTLTAYLMVDGFFLRARRTDRTASLLRERRSFLAAVGGLGSASWSVSVQFAEKKSSFTAQNSA